MDAYCFKCRAKREISGAQQVDAEERPACHAGHVPAVQHQGLPDRQGLAAKLPLIPASSAGQALSLSKGGRRLTQAAVETP